jgi:hypothetical protein
LGRDGGLSGRLGELELGAEGSAEEDAAARQEQAQQHYQGEDLNFFHRVPPSGLSYTDFYYSQDGACFQAAVGIGDGRRSAQAREDAFFYEKRLAPAEWEDLARRFEEIDRPFWAE